MVDHLYSGAFGNLVFKNMKERQEKSCMTKTVSIWSYVFANKAQFLNPLFSPMKRSLHAKYREKQLRVWKELFCCFDDSLKREQGANNLSTLQYPPLARSDLSLEEKLMAEVLRLKEENKQLREKLHHLEGETKLTLLPESEISEKEKLTLKQDSSESDEENPPQDALTSKKRDNSFDSPEEAHFGRKG